MDKYAQDNNTSIRTIIRRSNRAKNVRLRVIAHPLHVELVIPKNARTDKAMEFLASRQQWINLQIEKIPTPIALQPGATIPVLGNTVTIQHTGTIRGLNGLEGDILSVSGLPEHSEKRIEALLRSLLHQEVSKQATKYATLLGCTYRKISLKDVTSRWGSCSSNGNLSFAWTLVFAPLAVLHYVVAHEVAHLKEHNHSPKFWEIVAALMPDFEIHRSWLQEHGAILHRYKPLR